MLERPGVLTVGDRVVFGGFAHAVVAISGTKIRLLSDSGEASVVALPFLLAAEDFELVGSAPLPKIEPRGLLESLPEKALAEARDWERHVMEVETGLPPGAPDGAQPRPQFDPATAVVTDREKAKAVELKVSTRTVQRMRRRYRDQGLWGLVDSRYVRLLEPTGQVDPRVVAAATAVIAAQTHTSTGTKSRVIEQVRRLLDDEHGPGAVRLPSKATCYRLPEVLAVGRHTFGSAVTRRQTANKPDRVYTPTAAARPGELVHLDTTPLDVMAVMDDGVLGRAELVLAVDIATRTICAGVLRPVGAKSVDAALILARMMVPEPMRPGWDQALAMSASRIPYQRLVSLDARMALAAAKPVIVPDTVVVDHGKVFISEVFSRAADTLGISVQPAHELTATDKAIVERTFGSINTLFCQHASGYTGRDVTRRGKDVEDRAVWPLADLQELFDEWVLAGWQTRPHDGLRHPFTPNQNASPNDTYAALIAAAGYVPVTLSRTDYIELLPAHWRSISDAGVQIDYRTYNSNELRVCAGQSSGITSKGGRWEVHYDPYDVSRVWVRNHRGHGWFTVPWTHQSIVRQPFADFTWRAARKLAAQRGVDDANEMAVAVILAALLRRAEVGPDTSRPLARTASTRAMTNHLPAELVSEVGRWPTAIPGPPPRPALASSEAADDSDGSTVIEADGVEVVPFGLLDPFDEREGRW
ncbi:integrase [Nocardia sp. SYP-A9097]|uniref:Mu transposase C-terminal domain-containing protein n=1 Tax=Nocardia sp. SYP-A9097 TaxID=2663237 RepID=UPI00129C038F|nr:Mu transposase C-terminal domain-containing protein [Nocardia sp. SYP-A9097]MRH90535.1 integrase [Nocardia sp. SYP-A9097]